MTALTTSNMCTAQLECLGILFLRYPWYLRLWCFLLTFVNLAGVILFRNAVEVCVVAVVFALCHIVMSYLYQHHGGFTRLLGLAHAPWLILIPWLVLRVLAIDTDDDDDDETWFPLKIWLWIVVVLDSGALTVDVLHVAAYIQGEAERTYYWRQFYYDCVDDAAMTAAAEQLDGDHSESYYSTLSI